MNEEHGGIGGDVLSTAITWEEQYVFLEIHKSFIENRKFFLWKNLLPLFIYICFVNKGLRGKTIPLKLQIYRYTNTCTGISMKQVFFFILQSMKKKCHSECFSSWNIWFYTIIGWFESAWNSLKTLYSIRKPKCKMEITRKLTLYMYRHSVMFVSEWE